MNTTPPQSINFWMITPFGVRGCNNVYNFTFTFTNFNYFKRCKIRKKPDPIGLLFFALLPGYNTRYFYILLFCIILRFVAFYCLGYSSIPLYITIKNRGILERFRGYLYIFTRRRVYPVFTLPL